MECNVIELVNASVGYRTRGKNIVVASGLNGSFHEGELVSLIGRNGCGKSTLLRSIAGFQPLLDGKVLQQGREVLDYSIQERARLLSIVTTSAKPVPDMTVYDVVAMGRSPYTGFWGKLSANDKAIIDNSLQMVGMERFRDNVAAMLSDGERQKVLIAKAIAQETAVIILDEPTSFLDYPSKVRTMQLLRSLAHDHAKTVIVSTHDLEQALQFSDKMWLLDEHKNLIIKSPQQMLSEGILASCFGYVNGINKG